ncbi:MAG TPA: hypothetical protein VNW47_02280 [Terriglobales bacterium]|jgi:hypothetical protein|nr:hypothetical protein [Terriglobales bacterium]
MHITPRDWIALVVSMMFAFLVFGKIYAKAGYPRWYGLLMAIPFVNLALLVWFAYTPWPIETKLFHLELGVSPQSIWRYEA